MVTIQYLLPFMLTSSHRRSYCTAVVAFCLILRTGIVHKKREVAILPSSEQTEKIIVQASPWSRTSIDCAKLVHHSSGRD